MTSLSRMTGSFLLVCFLASIVNVIQSKELTKFKPPVPKKIPHIMEAHGVERVDNYYWMRDDTRKKKSVISHLEKENKYLEDWFIKEEDQRKKLFKEITDRIPKKKNPFLFEWVLTNILEDIRRIKSIRF